MIEGLNDVYHTSNIDILINYGGNVQQTPPEHHISIPIVQVKENPVQ